MKRTCKSGTDVLEQDRERSKQRKPSASGPRFGQDRERGGTIACPIA